MPTVEGNVDVSWLRGRVGGVSTGRDPWSFLPWPQFSYDNFLAFL